MAEDPREVYLQPECCANEYEGRLWSNIDAPVDCEEGVPWTRYVVGWEYDRLRAEVAECKKDAERYRWLEERPTATGLWRWMGHHQFLSTAIDAARKESE